MIETKFKQLCEKPSDISEHLPTLKRYAEECKHVTEVGVRWVVSTWSFLAANPKRLVSYDLNYHPNIKEAKSAAVKVNIDFEFKKISFPDPGMEETDLLFLDSHHVYAQLTRELKCLDKVRRYVILHDTTTFGLTGEDGGEGLKKALNEFLEEDPNWKVKEVFENNNGLTVLERISSDKPKVKIDRTPKEFKFEFGEKVFNKPPKVKFIIAFPDVPNYLWQVLVQMNNFARYGYDVDTHYLIGCFNGNVSKRAMKIFGSDKVKSKIHFYHDTRHDVQYPASLKPWLMSRYFRDFPKEKDSVYVYLDPDVIFLEDIDWAKFSSDDIWYESDTRSYLNTAYIKSKGDGLLQEMCDSVGISKDVVVENDLNAGGAQYILKNNTFELWDSVWRKSIDLYKVMLASVEKYKGQYKTHPIQYWTSEMWTTNWCAWLSGVETKVSDDLHFHFANHFISGPKHKIFHNAGITVNDGKHFCRIAYPSSPFNKELKCGKNSMSYFYVLEIKDTEENFTELIWE